MRLVVKALLPQLAPAPSYSHARALCPALLRPFSSTMGADRKRRASQETHSSASAKRGPKSDSSKPAAPKAATKSAMANFFAPTSAKKARAIKWATEADTVLIGRFSPPGEPAAPAAPVLPTDGIALVPIAAFDLDGTLIKTGSGKDFSRDENDWAWWDRCVPDRLRALHQSGHQIVIFSNQAGLNLRPAPEGAPKAPSVKRKRVEQFKNKCQAILDQLDLPVTLYAATGYDFFRKPRPGMWYQLQRDQAEAGLGRADVPKSFYVGDAAGRLGSRATKADISCSDRNLAANIGLSFFTPEEFFLEQSSEAEISRFDPSVYISDTPAALPPSFPVPHPDGKPELVVFVGSPGSGKSSAFRRLFAPHGYRRVNQDELKTRARCEALAAEILSGAGKQSVVVDNTNADAKVRAVWLGVAASAGVRARCVWFATPELVCLHNDAVRAYGMLEALKGGASTGAPGEERPSGPGAPAAQAQALAPTVDLESVLNPEKRSILPKIAFSGFTSRFEEPRKKEGFDSVVKIEFKFVGTPEQKAIWSMYWA